MKNKKIFMLTFLFVITFPIVRNFFFIFPVFNLNQTSKYINCHSNGINTIGTAANEPDIFIDKNDIIHVVWSQIVAGGKYIICYSNSSDNFSSKINVTETPSYFFYPKIAVDSNNIIHIIWDYKKEIDHEIIYSNSSSDFKKNITISNNPFNDVEPQISIDSQNIVHIIWSGAPSNNYDIYYANSSDNFVSNRTISNNSKNDETPALAIGRNDIIHIVWIATTNENLKYICYSNSSDDFLTNKSITGLGYYSSPDIAVDSCNVTHIVWKSEISKLFIRFPFVLVPDYDIFYANSKNNFNNAKDISFFNPDSDHSPHIAIDNNGNVYLTWSASITVWSYIKNFPVIILNYYNEIHYWSCGSNQIKKFYRNINCGGPSLAVNSHDKIYIALIERASLLLINEEDLSLFIPFDWVYQFYYQYNELLTHKNSEFYTQVFVFIGTGAIISIVILIYLKKKNKLFK